MPLNVSGPSDLGLFEVNEAAELVWQSAHPDANIIFGAVLDDQLADEVRITVIAAGFDRRNDEGQRDHAGDLRSHPRSLRRATTRSATAVPTRSTSTTMPTFPTSSNGARRSDDNRRTPGQSRNPRPQPRVPRGTRVYALGVAGSPRFEYTKNCRSSSMPSNSNPASSMIWSITPRR